MVHLISKQIIINQGSPDWHAWREGKIGSSAAGAIMGVSPFQTKLQFWEATVQGKKKEKTFAMERGSALEAVAREQYNEIVKMDFQPACFECVQYPDLIASLDGYCVVDGKPYALEIKCPNVHDHKIAVDGHVPDHYYPQCQHIMMLLHLESMVYLSFDGKEGAAVTIYRDDKYCDKLLEMELDFVKSLYNFKPPAPVDKDWVNSEANSSLIVKSFRYKELSAMIDELQEELDDIKQELIEGATHPRMQIGPLKIQRISRKGNIDYEKILEDYKITDAEKYRKQESVSWRIQIH